MSGAAGPDEPVPDSRIGSDLISRIPQARHVRTGHVEYGRACYYDIFFLYFANLCTICGCYGGSAGWLRSSSTVENRSLISREYGGVGMSVFVCVMKLFEMVFANHVLWFEMLIILLFFHSSQVWYKNSLPGIKKLIARLSRFRFGAPTSNFYKSRVFAQIPCSSTSISMPTLSTWTPSIPP